MWADREDGVGNNDVESLIPHFLESYFCNKILIYRGALTENIFNICKRFCGLFTNSKINHY